MSKEFTHKATGDMYSLRDDGNVLVTTPDRRTGVFTIEGEWVEGDLEFAEAVMCQFVGRSYPKDNPPPGVSH